MQILVNGQDIGFSLETEKTAKDVIFSFAKICSENSAAITSVAIDGKNIDGDKVEETEKIILTEQTKIEFTIETKQNVIDSLVALSEIFDALADKMENVSSCFQNGKEKEVHTYMTELADSINTFFNILAVACMFPDLLNDFYVDGKSFEEFMATFPKVLSQLESAIKNSDTVLVSDMAEYEICPRLRALASALNEIKNRGAV